MGFKRLKKTIRDYESRLSILEVEIVKKRVKLLDIDDILLKKNYYLSLLAEHITKK